MENKFIRVMNAETKMDCLINVSKITWIRSLQDDGAHFTIVKLSDGDCISTIESTGEILYLIESV